MTQSEKDEIKLDEMKSTDFLSQDSKESKVRQHTSSDYFDTDSAKEIILNPVSSKETIELGSPDPMNKTKGRSQGVSRISN